MLQKHKKMQKQSESLVGMLVSYKAGQGRTRHTPFSLLRKQKCSWTSVTAQGGPT